MLVKISAIAMGLLVLTGGLWLAHANASQTVMHASSVSAQLNTDAADFIMNGRVDQTSGEPCGKTNCGYAQICCLSPTGQPYCAVKCN
jgi:hypothetical protein